MSVSRAPVIAAVLRYAARLRFRQLFLITGTVLVLDLLVPDLVPFVDEVLLGLLTLLFGTWRKGRNDEPEGGSGGRSVEGKVADSAPPRRRGT
jgi:hypothetical protein